MELSVGHDQPGEFSKLEPKVVLALSRLQKGRYPSRQGRSSGVASKQVANYLANHYCYLDGDIESQAMTALLSCVKTGLICALKSGKFRLLNPNKKNMTSNCVARTSHGPECTCLKLITSIRKNSHKTCCSYNADGTKIVATDNGKSRRRKPVTGKKSKQTKLKVKRRTTRRTRRTPIKNVKKKEKLLEKQKVAPPAVGAGSDEKIQKCKYCLEKHPRPSEKRVCPKCHPPGTRYGVPRHKFSPREEITLN